MIRIKGGQKARQGTYWNLRTLERVDISTEGTLPGGEETTYYRLPATGVLLLGPVIGLAYAAFLPFIGIAMAVKLVAEKLAGTALAPAPGAASFGWRPSESYLSGKKKAREEKKEEKEEENG